MIKDISAGIACAVATALVWCVVLGRTTVDAWGIPLAYTEPHETDTLWTLTGIKAAMDGVNAPLAPKIMPHLGAPGVADWSSIPGGDELLTTWAGLFAVVFGLFAGTNIMTMLAHAGAALGMFVAGRWLEIQRPWAAVMGMVFGLSPFIFARGQHHLVLASCWNIPVCCAVLLWLWRGNHLQGWKLKAALAVGFLTGLKHVYYPAMFLQLVALGIMIGWIRGQNHNFKPGVGIISATLLGVALMQVDLLLAASTSQGTNIGVVRDLKGMEMYALKIADLFIPVPTHRWWGSWSQTYFDRILLNGEVPPGTYLGLVGLAGLLLLSARGVVAMVRGQEVPPALLMVMWIVAFATVAGLNQLLAVAGFDLLRSGTRWSIFIQAIALLYLAQTLQHRPVGWGAAMLGLAVLDQTPTGLPDRMTEIQRAVAGDQQFAETLEASLPAESMVFQLPMMVFPEGPVWGVPSYEHLKPGLYTESLRYQFGEVKGRALAPWLEEAKTQKLGPLVQTLESQGFSALVVNGAGYEPDEVAFIRRGLIELGRTSFLEHPHQPIFAVRLHPTAQ